MIKTVSVIVTTYNSERTIERTLRSIVNQEGLGQEFAIELIVVDDCSIDRTVELVSHFDAIVLTTNENSGGPNKGRNMGLRRAGGDYICIVDHDDEWRPHKLMTQLPHLDNAPIVSSGYSLISIPLNGTTEKLKPLDEDVIYYESNETFLNKLSKSHKGQNSYMGSIIYRNELKNILFEEVFGMSDFDWILRMFHGRDSIELNQSLYLRYVDGQNLSLNEAYRKRDFHFSLMHIEEYVKEYPQEVKKAYGRLYASRARYYYLMGQMDLARFYLLRSPLNLKNIGYYFTSFWGAEYIKKKFNVFG